MIFIIPEILIYILNFIFDGTDFKNVFYALLPISRKLTLINTTIKTTILPQYDKISYPITLSYLSIKNTRTKSIYCLSNNVTKTMTLEWILHYKEEHNSITKNILTFIISPKMSVHRYHYLRLLLTI